MELSREIDVLVKDIWEKQMKEDYDKCVFWEESVLKSAFYHHLRQGIRDKALKDDLVLYPEMRVISKGKPLRIDLAVVEIPECGIRTSRQCETKWKKDGSCITKLIAVFEFKHWEQKYPKPLHTALRKFTKSLQDQQVYYCYDKSRRPLTADLLYFCIILDKWPTREQIIEKPISSTNLRILIGGSFREKIEFKYL